MGLRALFGICAPKGIRGRPIYGFSNTGESLLARAADLAASTPAAIVEVLVKKSVAALDRTGLSRIVIAMAAAMRLQSGREQANYGYAFDVKPRWGLDSLAGAAGQ